MAEIGVRELKEKTSDVLRRVRDQNESIDITYRGRIVARLIPWQAKEVRRRRNAAVWKEMDRLAEEISHHWPKGVSAAEAVAEQRR
jgi:prevent-host-death family protein